MKARLKADYIFHIKPRIEGLLQIGYPCVALSALAVLFCVYLGLRYGPKPAFACLVHRIISRRPTAVGQLADLQGANDEHI